MKWKAACRSHAPQLCTHRVGGLEPDVIAEAHLNPDSIFAGIQRFAKDREERITSQRELLGAL
jgi:hypothetical protein